MLAALVEPERALANLRRLEREGALARYGFYESIDYTPERLPQNQKRVMIRAFMAHHQGMSLVALDNLLNDDVMQRRFHAEPLVQATELLLQERIPRGAPAAHPRAEEVLGARVARTLTGLGVALLRHGRPADAAHADPLERHLLGDADDRRRRATRARGALAVTRWREDAVRDHYGSFYYLRDVRTRRRLVCRVSADRAPAALLRSHLLGRQG